MMRQDDSPMRNDQSPVVMKDIAAVDKLMLTVIEYILIAYMLPGRKGAKKITFDDVIRKINATVASLSVTPISK
jgi:hypothetical protein